MSRNTILPIPRTQINANTFTGNYLPINAGGLPEACSIIRIFNDTNRDIFVSYDGTTGHDYIKAEDKLEWNLQTNSAPSNHVAKLAKGTIIYVLAAAGLGFVFLSGFYQQAS